jgi:exosortase
VDAGRERVDEKIMSTLTGQSQVPPGEDLQSGEYVPSPTILWMCGLSILITICLSFWTFFNMQVRLAVAEPSDWGHIFVVPLIAIWFIWLKKEDITAKPLSPSWAGLAFIALGILIFTIGSIGPKQLIHHLVRAGGVFWAVFGLLVLFTGWRGLRLMSFSLFYTFVFGVVITKRIMTPITNDLQDISARGAWFCLRIMGFDVDLAGNTLTLHQGIESFPLNVAEACSGMRMLVAFLALGTAMAYVGLSRSWQRLLLVLLGVPVAIFVNILRVMTLGLLSRFDVNFVSGDFHTFIGLIWLIPAFLVFILLMWVVRKLVVETPEVHSDTGEISKLRFTAPIVSRTIAAIFVFILGAATLRAAVVQYGVFLEKKTVPLRASLDTIPPELGGWSQYGTEADYSDAVQESLGTDLFIDRNYVNEDDSIAGVSVHIAYYTGAIDDVPHIPERCWYASGLTQMTDGEVFSLDVDQDQWVAGEKVNRATDEPYLTMDVTHPITGQVQIVNMPVGDIEIRAIVFENTKNPDIRTIGGYFFIANGRLTPSSFGVRNLAFDWTEEYAYYCKVQFSAAYRTENGENSYLTEYKNSVEELTRELLPQLMRCLPDWSEIENPPTESMD